MNCSVSYNIYKINRKVYIILSQLLNRVYFMKGGNKSKYLGKLAVVFIITLAFIMPVTALNTASRDADVQSTNSLKPTVSSADYGWELQDIGWWEMRITQNPFPIDENICWVKAADWNNVQGACQEFAVTTDAGENWYADRMFGVPEDGSVAMIAAVDENNAWVPVHSSETQGIYHTSDGGETWARQETADYNLDGSFPNVVYFWDENDGFAQGDPVDGYYELYTTSDGGETWERVPSDNIPAPLSGEFGVVGYYDVVGDTIWWSTQFGRVYKSEDRGYTWTVSQTPLQDYTDVEFDSLTHGYAIIRSGSGDSGICAETNDGGDTWELIDDDGFPDGDYGNGDMHAPVEGTYYSCAGLWAGASMQGVSYSYDAGHTYTLFQDWGAEGEDPIANYPDGIAFCENGDGWVTIPNNLDGNLEEGGIWHYTAPDIPVPILSVKNIAGGVGVTAEIENVGDAEATNVEWSITLDGTVFLGGSASGTISSIGPGESATISSGFPLGFGDINIQINAECAEGASASGSAAASLLLFLVQM